MTREETIKDMQSKLTSLVITLKLFAAILHKYKIPISDWEKLEMKMLDGWRKNGIGDARDNLEKGLISFFDFQVCVIEYLNKIGYNIPIPT